MLAVVDEWAVGMPGVGSETSAIPLQNGYGDYIA